VLLVDAKRRLKHVLGRLVYGAGLHRRLLSDRAVIALFHRVDDALAGNPITCTTSEFRSYCSFFQRYFTVVSLEDLLGRLRRRESVGGCLAITFDDGYVDNAETAAPELKRRGLPAAFFVATNFIESNHVPWWDADRSITSRWMTWDDVRAIRDRGFEVGSHTMNHVDLGRVDGAEADAEIAQSRARLEAELGAPVLLFSYPYGRPENFTEANRERVRRAGYGCCLSAHGGTVRIDSSPFDLHREPVSPWHLSPYHFGFELLFHGSAYRPTSPSVA
jgi:peptidoglycan/xylan/chitin deacetylase (PgdA/CDA1 family)